MMKHLKREICRAQLPSIDVFRFWVYYDSSFLISFVCIRKIRRVRVADASMEKLLQKLLHFLFTYCESYVFSFPNVEHFYIFNTSTDI